MINIPGDNDDRIDGESSALQKPTSTAMLVESDPEDYKDAEESSYNDGQAKVPTVDLFDIGKEGEMAPLVLPRDEKKWKEEEDLRMEHEKAVRKLRLQNAEERRKKKEVKDEKGEAKVKLDPYEEEERLSSSLIGSPAVLALSTSVPLTPSQVSDETRHAQALQDQAFGQTTVAEGLTAVQEAATLGAEDVQIKVKREDISTYFNYSAESARQERFYVFQFPRLFPQFYDPGDPDQSAEVLAKEIQTGSNSVKNESLFAGDVKPSVSVLADALSAGGASSFPAPLTNPYDASAKHKIKSSLHESESDAWRDYEAGKWQGWGRNPGREDREAMSGNRMAHGRVGKIKIRKSGKTTLKLGNIEYEVRIELLIA